MRQAVWSVLAGPCAFYSLRVIQRGINENPWNTGWIYMLIWVFACHTGLIVGFVGRWLNRLTKLTYRFELLIEIFISTRLPRRKVLPVRVSNMLLHMECRVFWLPCLKYIATICLWIIILKVKRHVDFCRSLQVTQGKHVIYILVILTLYILVLLFKQVCFTTCWCELSWAWIFAC